jgi:hypothetical protein
MKIPQDAREYYLAPNSDWYEFCTKMNGIYLLSGDKVAALFYWTIRFIDNEIDCNPCTDEGFRELQEYWDYKCHQYNL